MNSAALCFLTATELARLIRSKEVSAFEVMEAHLRQIERVNPKVNAIVTLLSDRAMDGARVADERLARGADVGLLHGLPIAHKDLVETKGIRTTKGSPIYKDYIPDQDALIVERLRTAGAITIGKTNTPEFGAGSQTFNPVFGATLNPYDTTKTCGGSSGGAYLLRVVRGVRPAIQAASHFRIGCHSWPERGRGAQTCGRGRKRGGLPPGHTLSLPGDAASPRRGGYAAIRPHCYRPRISLSSAGRISELGCTRACYRAAWQCCPDLIPSCDAQDFFVVR